MTKRTIALSSLGLGFLLGVAGALGAAKPFDASVLQGDKHEVSARLLSEAQSLAGKGSWERIAVGRVKYLSGHKAEGQALFDAVLGGKPEASDYQRIAAVYAIAGEWDKAKGFYDKAIAAKPGNSGILTEAGAWHNLKGDRKKAEEMFAASLGADPGDFWNRVVIAASYEGQEPF